MNRKFLLKTSILIAALGLAGAANLFGIDQDTAEKLRLLKVQTARYAIPADSRDHPASGQPVSPGTSGRYMGSTAGASSNLGCTAGLVDPDRGITVGCTFYDYQKNGTMDRQIATAIPDHVINFTWMNQDNNSATGGRNVRYEAYDPAVGALGDGTGGQDIGGSLIPPDRSGYTTIDAANNGTAINAHHWDKNSGVGGSRAFTNVFQNQTPSLADFVGSQIPDSIFSVFATAPTVDQNIWPRVAYTNGATPVTHVVAATDNTIDNHFMYSRKVGSNPWEPGFVFGFSGVLGHSITASRFSNDVAIGWIGGRGDGTASNCSFDRSNGLLSGQWDNDMYYMKSTDAGANWGPCINVTLRPDSLAGGFAPNARHTVLVDQAGVFHMAWNATVWNGYGGPFTFQSRLFHWDESSGAIRTAADAVWNPTTCNPGAFKQNLGEVQLTECDNKLYLTFAQYAVVPEGRGDDCEIGAGTSPGGAANGDIYVAVSANSGFNWDPPRNLTDSYTPNCDTVVGGANPDCDSDAWPSAIRYGIDVTGQDFDGIPDLTGKIDPSFSGSNFVFVQYINDAQPGGAIVPEAGWTDNAVKAFRFGCVDIVPAAVLASSIPTGLAVQDPAHTLPGTDSVLTWKLENAGNTDLTYTMNVVNDAPAGNVVVAGGSGMISAGAVNFENLTITLNANLEEDVQNASATIVVSGNFTSSPDTFQINYAIADVQLLVSDSLDGFMALANNGNIGFANNNTLGGLNLDFQGDPAECDTSAITYLFDGSPIVSFDGGRVVSGMFSQQIVTDSMFRPLAPPFVDVDGQYQHANSGTFTTQDSTLGLTADYWTLPGNLTGASGGTWKAVIGRAAYYNLTGAPIDSVFTAYGWDWDVPSDSPTVAGTAGSRNSSTIEPGATPTYLYQQGAEFGADTGNAACKDNSTRYAASIFTPPSAAGEIPYTDGGSGEMGVGFQSLYTRDNATFVGGGWNSPLLDSMLHKNFGFNIFTSPAPDSQVIDLHTILNGGAYRIDPDDTLYLWFRMLTGFGTQSEFESAALATKALANPGSCCVKAGDANHDARVNIADVTFLIARIFAGGPGPSCCEEGSANGDNKVNIADVTFLIARIFAGGPAPVCGPVGIGC